MPRKLAKYLFVSFLLATCTTVMAAGSIKQGMQFPPSVYDPSQTQRAHLGIPLPATAFTGGPEIDICSSTPFFSPTIAYWDDNNRSYRSEMWVNGVQVSDFGENWNIPLHGPSTYFFGPDAYAVPPNTEVRILVYSYRRPDFQGLSFISEAVINCTTGLAIEIINQEIKTPPVPTLSEWSLSLLVLVLSLMAVLFFKRRRQTEVLMSE